MPEENDLIRRVIIETDEAQAKKTIDSLKALKEEQARVAREIADGTKSYQDGGKELRKLRKSHDALSQTLSDEQRDYLKQNRLLKEYEEQVESASKANKQLARSFGEVADSRRTSIDIQGAGFSGDIASSTAGIRGGLEAVGISGASGILEVTEAFADFGEFVPQLAGQISTLGEGFQLAAAASTGLAGNVAGLATNTGAAIAGVTGMSVATATFLTVALPVAAAVGAAALALANFNAQAEEQRKILSATIEAQRTVNQAVAEGLTTDEAQARLDELRRLREGEAETLDTLEDAYSSMEQQLGVLSGAVKVFDGREDELASQIDQSSASIQGYDTEIRALERSLEDGSLAANDAIISEDELANKRKEAAQVVDQALRQSEAKATQALSRATQINEQIAQQISQREDAQANALEIEEAQARFAEEDRLAQAKEHQDKLGEIQKEGNARLQELQSGFAELATERAEALADVDTKGGDNLAKLRDDFFKKQLSATEKFSRETRKIEDQRAKEIRRITEDTLDSQRKAVLANDVAAFIEATEQGNQALARAQEDASETEKERAEELVRQRQEEIQAFQDRRAEIIKGIDEEKAKIIESFAERQIALQTQIDQEKIAIQERLQAERDAETERLAQLEQRAAREAELNEIRQRQEQEAFDERLNQLREQERAAQEAYNTEVRNQQQLQSLKQNTHNLDLQALNELTSGTQNLISLAGQLQTSISQAQTQARSTPTGGGFQSSRSRSSFGSRGSSGVSRGGGLLGGLLGAAEQTVSRFGYRGSGFRGGESFHTGGRVLLPSGASEGLAVVKPNELILPSGSAVPIANNGGLDGSLARSMQGASAGGAVNINLSPQYNMTVGDIANRSEVSNAIYEANRILLEELNRMLGDRTK